MPLRAHFWFTAALGLVLGLALVPTGDAQTPPANPSQVETKAETKADTKADTKAETKAEAEARVAEGSARKIVQQAHAAAGGALWQRPKTLHLRGTATLYQDERVSEADHYEMWRVFPAWGGAAHAASGKVRIDAAQQSRILFQTSFDGEHSYNQFGRVETAAANREWSENFGFGIIRFALDPGFKLTLQPPDQVEKHPCHVVSVTDAVGGITTFWIDRRDYAIRKVAFDTPRGWHERIYSDFFRVLPSGFMQPGRVRLYYRGIKSNDVRWTWAEVNREWPDALFALPAKDAPGHDALRKQGQ